MVRSWFSTSTITTSVAKRITSSMAPIWFFATRTDNALGAHERRHRPDEPWNGYPLGDRFGEQPDRANRKEDHRHASCGTESSAEPPERVHRGAQREDRQHEELEPGEDQPCEHDGGDGSEREYRCRSPGDHDLSRELSLRRSNPLPR